MQKLTMNYICSDENVQNKICQTFGLRKYMPVEKGILIFYLKQKGNLDILVDSFFLQEIELSFFTQCFRLSGIPCVIYSSFPENTNTKSS